MCRCGPTTLSGGTIDTGNAKIMATIHTSAGKLASGAKVSICPATYLPAICADSATNMHQTVKETITDDSGYFHIDTLEAGAYRIEVNDGRSSAALWDVTLDSVATIIDDTLRPYAVVLGNAGTLSDTLIKRCLLVYGLNRRIAVNANGSFSISDLPAGTFRFRIAAEAKNSNVTPVDCDSVIARSSDTVSVPFAGWKKKAAITLNTSPSGANVARDVYGFPLLIRLSKSNFHFSQASGSGNDCRFAKADGSPLAFEIERWDPVTELAEVWVRVDTIFGNNATQSFLMFWGNPQIASGTNGTAVFDTANGFLAAYHFSGNLNDATWNEFNGIDNGTTDLAEGIIGRCRGFSGASYFHPDSLPDRPSGTISCWIKPEVTINSSTSATLGIWGKKTSDSLDYTLSFRGGNDFFSGPGGAKAGGAGNLLVKFETPDTAYYLASATSSFSSGVWYYVSWTWSEGKNILYINGSAERSDTNSLGISGDANDEIGRSFFDTDNIAGGGPLYFKGSLDEFRMDKRLRSADWIKLCYMNQQPDDKLVKIESR